MSVYYIDQQIASLVDPETGEIMDYEHFWQLQMERDAVIENMVLSFKNDCADAAAIKAEEAELFARRKKLEERAEQWKSYIAMSLNGEKFSTPRCVVSWHKSYSLDVPKPDDVIDWAQRTGHLSCIRQRPPELEKKAVSELLKSGVYVPGAKIITKNNVTIK